DASLGIFKLSGSCRLLNILYQAGVGERSSEGHGKFEVIA
ncbi:MAG: CRISPR-associated endoribonuclease Cas6, partial [Lachnospiraceae bacterium]|nr:CRISPR-associated endoribonuclease Cas6 [Lachnospiraceae bacterium]